MWTLFLCRAAGLAFYVMVGWFSPAFLSQATDAFGPLPRTEYAIQHAQDELMTAWEMNPKWRVQSSHDFRLWLLTSPSVCEAWVTVSLVLTDVFIVVLGVCVLMSRDQKFVDCVALRCWCTTTVVVLWACLFTSPYYSPLTFNWLYFTQYQGPSSLWYQFPPLSLSPEMSMQTLLVVLLYHALQRTPLPTKPLEIVLVHHWLWMFLFFAASRPNYLFSGLVAAMWVCLVCRICPMPPPPLPPPPPPPPPSHREKPRPLPIPMPPFTLVDEDDDMEAHSPLLPLTHHERQELQHILNHNPGDGSPCTTRSSENWSKPSNCLSHESITSSLTGGGVGSGDSMGSGDTITEEEVGNEAEDEKDENGSLP